MAEPRLAFDRVTKTFRDRTHPRVLRDAIPSTLALLTGRREPLRTRFVAVEDLSFDVAPGEALAIVGRNGAGKSTTLKLAAGIFRTDSGEVRRAGRIAALIELSAGFHPDLSGRENVFLSGALLGLRRTEVKRFLGRILDFADIGGFADAPLRVYSTGMIVRLGFAVAAHVPSEILLVDEVLAVGDIEFHAKCIDRMAERRAENVSLLLVSHQLAVVEQFCDRALVVDHGRKVAEGPPAAALDEYRRSMLAPDKAPHASADPQIRCGSGDVRIVGVTVHGGAPGAPVRAGRPFVVALELDAVPGAPTPTLGVEVHSLDGVLVARAESPGAEAPLGAARSRAEVLLRRNSLLPGAYALTVFARDPAGHRDFDVQSKLHRFAVEGERTGGERGVVSLDASWTR